MCQAWLLESEISDATQASSLSGGQLVMNRNSPLSRQWKLLRLLSRRANGLSIRALASEMEVSTKTIRRDFHCFQQAGFPLQEDTGQFGRKTWRVEAGWDRPELSFTFDEALALYFGRQFLQTLAGTFFWEAAQRAFQKIRASLGENVLRYVDKISRDLHTTTPGLSDYSSQAQTIDELLVGIEDRRVVFITYQSQQATEPVTYDIHPYSLTWHRGSLYLVGYAPQHEEIRHWKVDRIHDAEVDQMPFQRPADFDVRSHLNKSRLCSSDGQQKSSSPLCCRSRKVFESPCDRVNVAATPSRSVFLSGTSLSKPKRTSLDLKTAPCSVTCVSCSARA